MSSEWASSTVYYICMMAVFNSSLIFFLIGSIPFSQPQIPFFLILEKLFCILLSNANERAHTVSSCLHQWLIRTASAFQIHFKGHLYFTNWNFFHLQLTFNTLTKYILGNYFLITTQKLHSIEPYNTTHSTQSFFLDPLR